jgi:cytochrome c-type biogenesis protein CcmH/NrfF
VLDLVDSTDRQLLLIKDTVPTVALWVGPVLVVLGAVQLVLALRAARTGLR